MSDQVRYVRLRNFDPKTGHTVRSYSHRYSKDGQFYQFDEPGVWNAVPLALAEELEKIRQNPLLPSSPPVFDVYTESEARRVDAAAKAEREARIAKIEPSVDTARVVETNEPGRGDLSLEEVTSGRKGALEDASRRAAGDEKTAEVERVTFDEPMPPRKPGPKPRSRKQSKRKK